MLAVRVDTTKHGTRWYPGAGIYRKVTLQIRNPIHVGQWATFVTTPEVSDERATVAVRTTVENHTDRDAKVGVVFRFRDPDGKPAGAALPIPSRSSCRIERSRVVDAIAETSAVGHSKHHGLYTVETAIVPSSAPIEGIQGFGRL